MTERPYDLLLLDFGGVCLMNPAELHAVAEEKLGLPAGTFSWLGPIDPSTDPLWQELFAAGEGLREREYWQRRAADVGEAAGLTMSLTDYMKLLYDPPDNALIRPGATDAVERAFAAGMNVSVLTNDLKAFHGPDWQGGIDLLQRVDHVVDCSDTGILKPDARAFQRALDITGFGRSQVLFVDDQKLSVAGAGEFGIDAVWFDLAQPAASWASVADRIEV